MKRQRRIGPGRRTVIVALLAGVVVLLAACGGTAARPTPSPASTPTTAPASTYQALVVTHVIPPGVQGHFAFSLYDSSTGQARQVGSAPLEGNLQFGPGDRLSAGSYAHIVSMDMNGGSRREEVAPPVGYVTIGDYAWSRDGTLAYLLMADGERGSDSQLVVRPASGAGAQVPFGPVPAGATGSVRFSSDGTKVLIDAAGVQVRGLDGKLLFSATGGAEATWGLDGRVWFWDSRGVHVADPATGTTTMVLPSTHWYSPNASPDGKRIVYEIRDAQGGTELRVLDTTTMQADTVRVGGHDPRFVSSAELWFHEQAAKDPSMTPLVSFDLQHRDERSTGLSGVLSDVRQVPIA